MTHLASIALTILAQLSPQPTSRVIAQHGCDWQISLSFHLSPSSPSPLTIAHGDLSLRITGDVSTSRSIAPDRPGPHAFPRPACHVLDGYHASSAVVLHGNPASSDHCSEIASLTLWSDTAESLAAFDRPSPMPDIGPPAPPIPLAGPPGDAAPPGPVTVPVGGVLHVRITLKHDPASNDPVDPLLGIRPLSLTIGRAAPQPTADGPPAFTYRDTLDLSRERYYHLPDRDWRPMDDISGDHRDDGIFFSAPDSLILDASEPGCGYLRLPERRVRGNTKMRIKFRYMVAPGCDGEVKVRVAQYNEGPNQWRVLSDGGFERELRKPPERPKGKRGEVPAWAWLVHEEVFTTQVEANKLAVDFRVSGAEWGLAWVDDIAVEYVGVGDGGVGSGTAP